MICVETDIMALETNKRRLMGSVCINKATSHMEKIYESYHLWYSLAQEARSGSSRYIKKDGTEFVVSMVTRTKECALPDAKYLGQHSVAYGGKVLEGNSTITNDGWEVLGPPRNSFMSFEGDLLEDRHQSETQKKPWWNLRPSSFGGWL
jgi:hypothetical protein